MSEEWLHLFELTQGWRSCPVDDWISREILRPYVLAGLDMEDMRDWLLHDAMSLRIGELVDYDVERYEHARLFRC